MEQIKSSGIKSKPKTKSVKKPKNEDVHQEKIDI